MGSGGENGDTGSRMDWYLRTADTAAVPPLRKEIMSFLRRHAASGDDFGAAELVIGELLNNAVAYAPERARVSLRWDHEHPVLSVANLGHASRSGQAHQRRRRTSAGAEVTALPVPTLPEDPLADSGRGLYIAGQLARDLAVRARGGAPVVSATLNIHRESPTDARPA